MSKFTVGLLAGVAIGLLVAPEPGEETRQNLSDTANKWRDQFNKLLGRAGAGIDDIRTMLESEIDGLNDDAKGKIAAILDDADKVADKGKRAIQDSASDVKNAAKDVASDVRSGAKDVASDVRSAAKDVKSDVKSSLS